MENDEATEELEFNDPIDEASDHVNDYLDEMISESEDVPDEEPEFDKNEEGSFGDEWKEKEIEKTLEEIRKEENRKNAERRIRNKNKHHQEEESEDEDVDEEDEDEEEIEVLEDEDLDAESARVYRERLDVAESFINENISKLNMINELQLDEQKISMGHQFVEKWSRDPIGLTKELLTFLENKGIDIGQIYDHQVDNHQQMIDAEVNRRMQPFMQQQMQAEMEQRARQTLDNFLGRYPDANDHLEEIVEVMRRANLRDPYDAYDRLRRVYAKNGIDWFGRQPQEYEEPVPQMSGRSRSYIETEQEPASLLDLVRRNARKHFNGET